MYKYSKDKPEKPSPESAHGYRKFVGSATGWDTTSARQFNLLTALGLKEEHYVLDIGCGSLRTGRLLIPYLLPGHYYGIEPKNWLIEEGINNECGKDLIRIKAPVFSNDDNFTCTQFGRKFDFILAYSIFTHAPQAHIRRCISQVKECMKPNSIFAATFYKGDKNYTGAEWVYPDFVTYTSDLIKQIVSGFGLECHPMDWYHHVQTLVLITYPENKLGIPSDSNLIPMLMLELNQCKSRLKNLESHPYVRFGLKVNRGIRRIKKSLR